MVGEAGKEAVLPLDRNTGWMDDLAAKINGSGSGVVINITVDGGTLYGDLDQLAQMLGDKVSRQMRSRGLA